METFSFVILHFGDTLITNNCIDSILELHTNAKLHIVIVDNDYQKDDESRAELRKRYPQDNIDILYMRENAGFSCANNRGYAYTIEHHQPDYVIVANNDIVFTQHDFLERIRKSHEVHDFDVLSPDIVSREDGRHQSPIDTSGRTIKQVNHTIFMNWMSLKLFPFVYPMLRRRFSGTEHDTGQIEDIHEAKSDIVPCGACLILSKRFIKQEDKVFAPETQFYYEEYILHHRCRQKGYRVIYDPSLQVMHGDGVATKKRAKNDKNRLRFMLKHTLASAKIYKELIHKK